MNAVEIENVLSQWLTLTQVAVRLGVKSPYTVSWYCATGRLQYITTPLGRLYDPTSVEKVAAWRAARKKRVAEHE